MDHLPGSKPPRARRPHLVFRPRLNRKRRTLSPIGKSLVLGLAGGLGWALGEHGFRALGHVRRLVRPRLVPLRI